MRISGETFITAILGLFVCLVGASPSYACTLLETPRNFNTQVFVLQYPENPPVEDQSSSSEAAREAPTASDAKTTVIAPTYGLLLEPLEPLTREPDRVIFIGNQPNRPFQVIVTDSRRSTLLALRTCILDAFSTQTRLGEYIQVGSFANRSEADALHRRLQRAGYPSRVIHNR